MADAADALVPAQQPRRRLPDSGQTFLPVSEAADVPDNAPRPLDHFKRGYNERTEMRERESTGLNTLLPYTHNHTASPTPPPPPSSSSSNNNNNSNKYPDPKKWQPPPAVLTRDNSSSGNVVEEGEVNANYYAPPAAAATAAGSNVNYPEDKPLPQQPLPQQQQQVSYNKHNSDNINNNNNNNFHNHNNYNKYDDKLYTRNSNNYDDRMPRNNHYNSYKNNSGGGGNSSGGGGGGGGGISMEEVVDRLCHPHANVFDEMDHARATSPEFFLSGRAITAILSQLGRRRQMRVAMSVWKWMEQTSGITRNVYHYNALINVCEKIKDWKGALDLLKQMDEEKVPKNEITYSSAISACEKGGNWRTALDLLKTMKEKRIMPTAIAYNAGRI